MPIPGGSWLTASDVTRLAGATRRRVIARMFQDPRAGICERMSIMENIAVAAARTRRRGLGFAIGTGLRRLAQERLRPLGLGLENRLEDRVAFAVGRPAPGAVPDDGDAGPAKVLLLDEHTAALDPAAAEFVMALTARTVRRPGSPRSW